MKQIIKFNLIIFAFLSLSSFQVVNITSEIKNERKAQDKLPKSTDPMWHILGETKIKLDQKKSLYSAIYSKSVKDLDKKEVTIKGFMLPLEATEKFRHFLLSKRTPTCGFCPPGEPNEVVDVWVKKPIAWSENLVTVKGTFSLINDKELGLFFRISNATTLATAL